MPGFVTVVVNPVAVYEEIVTSPLWREHCEHMVEKGLAYAQSIAPVETGVYRDSLFGQVTSPTVPDAVPGAPSVVIGNSCDHWVEVEFQQPHRYLPLLRTFDYLAKEE